MTKPTASYIEEPDLVFGNRGEEKDPKLGLKYFGPYVPSNEETPATTQIRIGIAGTGETISLTKKILVMLANPIKSDNANKWLYPDFPGFSLDNNIHSRFTTSDTWNATIFSSETKHVLSIIDVNERIAAASDLFADKIRKISFEDTLPHVIICALPQDIEEYCGISERTRGAKKPKSTAFF